MRRRLPPSRNSGFTLTEMIIVITIIIALTAITAGTVKNVSSGNRRVACATNLHNVHQALRMYKLDEGKYPVYDPLGDSGTWSASNPGPGLWALFTYYNDGANPTLSIDAPESGYVSTPGSLHCPEDRDHASKTSASDPTLYDPAYCSYQAQDTGTGSSDTHDQYTYLTYRGESDTSKPGYIRQLWNTADESSVGDWEPAENTVITWCFWHRDRSNPKDHDLVLFLDGQVDFLSKPDGTAGSPWQRNPTTGTVE